MPEITITRLESSTSIRTMVTDAARRHDTVAPQALDGLTE